jgi:acyl-CoA synthetase (NDP forming)
VLEGTGTGLVAFRNLFLYRDVRGRPPAEPARPSPLGIRKRWAARLSEGPTLSPIEAFGLIRDYGIPAAPAAEASTREEAVAVAERLGWPVALKTASPQVVHKTEADGVRLGIPNEERLLEEYADLSTRLGPAVIVQGMAPGAVELALGIVRDPQFGPVVMVSAGGLLIEVLGDRRFALPPLDPARARAMLDRLAVRPLLDGVRGAAPTNLDAVVDAIVRLSVLAQELGDHLLAMDVNPLVAGPDGCLAVDALVVTQKEG